MVDFENALTSYRVTSFFEGTNSRQIQNKTSIGVTLSKKIICVTLSLPGALRVAGNLSSLAGHIFSFNAWASDSGTPRREALKPALVNIYVKKVNRFPPKFDRSHFKAQVQLPTIPGVKVMCLSAHDPDDRRGQKKRPGSVLQVHHKTDLTYSFSSHVTDSPFKLHNTGCLFVHDTSALEHKYNFSVEVSDGLFSSSSYIIVSVSEPTKKALIFSQEKYYANVLENSTKQVNLLVVRVQNLPLNHEVHYSILNPNDWLVIRPTSGTVQTTGQPFDREKASHFSILVQVIAFVCKAFLAFEAVSLELPLLLPTLLVSIIYRSLPN